jgi:hypothetical protein
MLHAALEQGDVQGVVAALRVMVTIDPQRAAALYDELSLAVDIAIAGRAR